MRQAGIIIIIIIVIGTSDAAVNFNSKCFIYSYEHPIYTNEKVGRMSIFFRSILQNTRYEGCKAFYIVMSWRKNDALWWKRQEVRGAVKRCNRIFYYFSCLNGMRKRGFLAAR